MILITKPQIVQGDSFSLTYNADHLVGLPYWFFELEPDYVEFPSVGELSSTAYVGGPTLPAPDYPDDYYGGIYIYGDEHLDIPTGITNTLTVTSPVLGFPEATWLLFIHNMVVNGDLDISRFINMSNFEIEQGNLSSITFPPSLNKDFDIDWSFYQVSGLTTIDLSTITVATTSLGIQIDLDIVENNVINLIFFSGDNGDGTIACDDVEIIDNPNLTTITFPDSPVFDTTSWFYIEGNSNLTTVNLTGNSSAIKNYAFRGNISYGYYDVTIFPNLTNVSNGTYYFHNNSWDAATINHVLVDLDSISSGGYTSRKIYYIGTVTPNAAPDSSSGGYDGLAAKTSLEGKGFVFYST